MKSNNGNENIAQTKRICKKGEKFHKKGTYFRTFPCPRSIKLVDEDVNKESPLSFLSQSRESLLK